MSAMKHTFKYSAVLGWGRDIQSLRHYFVAIDIRLNSSQYSQLRDRLLSPVRIARNVVFHQSLSERFAAAFAEQVGRNGVYALPHGSAVSYSHDVLCLVLFGVFFCRGGTLVWCVCKLFQK